MDAAEPALSVPPLPGTGTGMFHGETPGTILPRMPFIQALTAINLQPDFREPREGADRTPGLRLILDHPLRNSNLHRKRNIRVYRTPAFSPFIRRYPAPRR